MQKDDKTIHILLSGARLVDYKSVDEYVDIVKEGVDNILMDHPWADKIVVHRPGTFPTSLDETCKVHHYLHGLVKPKEYTFTISINPFNLLRSRKVDVVIFIAKKAWEYTVYPDRSIEIIESNCIPLYLGALA